MKPYETIQELLEDAKIHGPYLIPINITPKKLIYPIEIKDDGITIYIQVVAVMEKFILNL